VLRARMQSVLEIDCTDQLLEVRVPILYLQAQHDHVVPSSAMRTIVELVPSVQVVSLNGPHMLLQAVPANAAAVVNQFVRDTAGKADAPVDIGPGNLKRHG